MYRFISKDLQQAHVSDGQKHLIIQFRTIRILNLTDTYMEEFLCFGIHSQNVKVPVLIGWSLMEIEISHHYYYYCFSVYIMFYILSYKLTK